MTLYGEPRVWLERFPLGEPVPFMREHLGLRYSGEVVRTDQWSPELGRPLEGDLYFRIVLLRRRRGGLRPVIQDPRIALCLPASGLSRRRNRLNAELGTIRETQAIYLTDRDTEADLIRRTLERRQEGLEEQMMGEESVRYSEGEVLTFGDRRPDAGSLFAELDPMAWFSRLAGWLLAEAYPSLPLDSAALPRSITGSDAAELYGAAFSQPDAGAEVLKQLGPALGLSDGAGTPLADPASCRVLELLRDRLSAQSGEVPWADIHHFLAHETGLTGPLATLYLMVYLRLWPPEMAVALCPSHQLSFADGRPLLGDRITTDLVPALAWNDSLAGWARTIGPVAEPQWNGAVQHLAALSPGLKPIPEGDGYWPQEQALLAGLDSLAREMARAQSFLDLLGQVGGEAARVAGAQNLAEALRRLSCVLRPAPDGFRSVYLLVRATYPDYRQLVADVALLHQMDELGRSAEAAHEARDYLEGAAVPSGRFPELSVDREALQAALTPASLLESRGRNWGALVRDIARFKSRYAAAYRAHHESVQRRLPAHKRELEAVRRELAALELLDTLPHLGEPEGAGLAGQLAELDSGSPSCAVPPGELQLESVPYCDGCRSSLQQPLPVERLARLHAEVDARLGAKNRRLSNLLVERVLRGHADHRLKDFLRIVRASDLAALTNTLTPELLTFIRRMLA